MEISDEDQLLALKFGTRDELLTGVRTFYSKRGHALSIFRSEPDKHVDLRCDRGGRYRNSHKISEEERKKQTNSRLINCMFQLRGKKHEDGMWTIEIKKNEHNHEPSVDNSGHPAFRRLTDDERRDVYHKSNSGIPPRQILSSISQNNAETRIISKIIGGKTLIEALFEELGRGGFKFNILRDEIDHIIHLFFANLRSVQLTKSFSNVFVMDCTYKTNKYKMPLLDIVGISSFNTSFFSAFAFLKKKSAEDYVWALEMFKETLGSENQPSVIITDRKLALMNAIREVFPSTELNNLL